MLQGAVGHGIFHIGADKDETFFTDIPPENQAFVGAPIQRVGMLSRGRDLHRACR